MSSPQSSAAIRFLWTSLESLSYAAWATCSLKVPVSAVKPSAAHVCFTACGVGWLQNDLLQSEMTHLITVKVDERDGSGHEVTETSQLGGPIPSAFSDSLLGLARASQVKCLAANPAGPLPPVLSLFHASVQRFLYEQI